GSASESHSRCALFNGRRGMRALSPDPPGPAVGAARLRVAAFRPRVPRQFRRRRAPRPRGAPPQRGRFRGRAVRRGGRARGSVARGHLPARVLRREPRTLGTRSGDVRRAVAVLGEHGQPARRRRARHNRPGRGDGRSGVPAQAHFPRGGGPDPALLAALSRGARRAHRRNPRRVRLLPADRLPFHAHASRAGGQPAGFRAGRRPRHLLRAARDAAGGRGAVRHGLSHPPQRPLRGRLRHTPLRAAARRRARLADRGRPSAVHERGAHRAPAGHGGAASGLDAIDRGAAADRLVVPAL
ncbi:MAG: N-formylglutamate deformylase, partial [uncultured Acetobacteraceae bacterium]